MSGSGASASIEGFIYVTFNAFHQTSVNFIGQNAGAGQYRRVKQVLYTCLASALVATLTVSFLAYGFGPQLLSIYITDSQEAISLGMTRLMYTALPYFLCALMDVTTGALRGIGASVTPMLISVLGVCGIRIAWIYTVFQMPQFHTPECLYLSYLISWTATFIFQTVAFIIIYKKRVQVDRSIPRMPEFKGEVA
jgi:Na+-driven multidrug efflux pump